jgi:DNA helicase HerA-like ATPase
MDTSPLGNVDGRAPESIRSLGSVVSVRGSHVTVGLAGGGATSDETRPTVGKFLGVDLGGSLLVGIITDAAREPAASPGEPRQRIVVQLDLVGEIKRTGLTAHQFQRGVADFPSIGDPVVAITAQDLKQIVNLSSAHAINVGHLQQNAAINAYIDVDDMISKHFAVLGTTGVGKSSGVALILSGVMQERPDVRIFVLDAHNEYGRCFGDRAKITNPRNLKLPFWLFNFEEIVDVFFGGRLGVDEEIDILAELIPLAKAAYGQHRGVERSLTKRPETRSSLYTVDRPAPYRLADLVALLDERMGKLENRSSRMLYHRLIARVENVSRDPRYAFMFENANVGGDTMAEVLADLFRLPPNGKPMTVMQLAGFPSEVVDAVVSVICRMAFDFGLWSDGAAPLLFVCEEAHRYISSDRNVGFGPTRRSISRIAKEGRKYGVFLGLVSQRPAELDATILSQCSTLFAMRMTNDRDQALLRSAVSDGAANLLAFLPSLGTREALVFGEGVALPTRLTFRALPRHIIPKSETDASTTRPPSMPIDQHFVEMVLERWRSGTTGPSAAGDEAKRPADAADAPAAESGEPSRFKLAKRMLSDMIEQNAATGTQGFPPRG